ncbi:thiol reductase thioredoxin [Domibacillus antri]|uniref:Thiol reductase thioredoxin n=1 Tax=Domibacillus antri TaxID=1714264 RepID=A0A1Q8Q8F1_9BACI|nr:thioredoxin family protein [Domibacillus antri]OLN23629.1 thiol reductase thioredoxin [Domibacillus antri]
MEPITSYAEFSDVLLSNEAVLLYVSSPGCSVCHALLPHVETLLREFPDVEAFHADTAESPEIAGQYTIFTAPALLFFIHGKEIFRMARFVPLEELKENITSALKMI